MNFKPESQMFVSRVVKQIKLPDGRVRNLVKTDVEEKVLDLGSCKQPKNTDIIKIEFKNQQPKTNMANLFDGFFNQ